MFITQRSLSHRIQRGPILPAVVFNLETPRIDVEVLKSIFARFEATDDVFSSDFISRGVLLAQPVFDGYETLPAVPLALQKYLWETSIELLFTPP